MNFVGVARGQRGFTLLELMIVVSIIAIVASMGFVKYRRVIAEAEEVVAVKELKDILAAIESFGQAHGHYPVTLDDLGLGPLTDPWGNPYQYLNFDPPEEDPGGNGKGNGKGKGNGGGNGQKRKDRFLVPINSHFDLYSMGPDGASVAPLTAAASQDDIIVANDGDYVGIASQF